MSAVTILELPGERQILYSLTIAQYHQMIEDRILPEGEPFELIHGQVIRKDRSAVGEDLMTVGNHHIWCVKRLAKLNSDFEVFGAHMQTQQPIVLPPSNEPEPDAAIVVGTEDDYVNCKPSASDVLCVIEVSESSLKYDRTVKLGIYADANIATYVIVNLPDQAVEVYTLPQIGKARYGHSESLTAVDTLYLPAPSGNRVSVPVRRLLP